MGRVLVGAVWGAASLFLLFHSDTVRAADVHVTSALAMSEPLKAVAAEFEKSSGHKLVFTFGTAVQVKTRVEAGEAVDVAISTAAAIDDLIKQGKLAAGSRKDIAKVGIGVAVRAGAPKPDISSPDAFKRALMAAKTIARGDPAAGGAAGTHVARVIEKLGIDAEVKAKSKLSTGPAISEIVAKGDAEIAITQISEIVPVKGVDLVGPLPPDLQNISTFSSAIGAVAKNREAADAFVTFLASAPAAGEFRKVGMEPG